MTLKKTERNAQIVKEHLAGKSLLKIAKELGISGQRCAMIFHAETGDKYRKTLVLKTKVKG